MTASDQATATTIDFDALLASERTWHFDPWHTTIQFATRNRGAGRVRGRFVHAAGTVESGPAVGDASVSVTIDVASLTTGVSVRDQHLRSPAFFDVLQYPTATFESTAVVRDGVEEAIVLGQLSFRGDKHEARLATRWEGSADDPFREGSRHLAFSGSTVLRLSELGMGQPLTAFKVPGIGDTVELTLDVVLLPYDPTPMLSDIPID